MDNTNLNSLNEAVTNNDISNVLNEWHDYSDGETSNGRPQWFKLWVEKYATALDIANIDEDLTPKEKNVLFREIGKVFINSLSYFMGHDEGRWSEYKPSTRDGRILWNALKRDIDQSYKDYDKRVKNGKTGGRPKKESI